MPSKCHAKLAVVNMKREDYQKSHTPTTVCYTDLTSAAQKWRKKGSGGGFKISGKK